MDTVIEKQEIEKQEKVIKPKIKYITLIVFILLLLALCGQFTYAIINYDRIYKGVYVENHYVGSFLLDEAILALDEEFVQPAKDVKITLQAGDSREEFTLSDIGISLGIKEAVEKAYSIGRTGNIFKRLKDVFDASQKGIKISIPVTFDKVKLESKIQSLYEKVLVKVKEADILVQDNMVAIHTGHSGKTIDKALALSNVEACIKNLQDASIEIPIIVTPPSKINVDDLYQQINREPQNAGFTLENKEIEVVPHVIGRKIDRSTLAAIANELANKENVNKVLPVEYIEPEITTEKAKELLFRDTLADFHTAFSTYDQNDKNRAENIKIAASIINETVLLPGEVFSFNDVVGPRTEKRGYKAAHSFLAGQIVDSIGGGICQVSSTLYNAVLLADFEVLERKNHMFTVGYVPKGMDATVSYGSVDFKFKNSTRWPIKILSWVKDNKIYFSIKGTNEEPDKSIKIVSSVVKTEEFPTIYIDDPNLLEGETRIKQNGQPGYVVDTYKIIKVKDKTIDQIKLHRSVYKPLPHEVIRGTKPNNIVASSNPADIVIQ